MFQLRRFFRMFSITKKASGKKEKIKGRTPEARMVENKINSFMEMPKMKEQIEAINRLTL